MRQFQGIPSIGPASICGWNRVQRARARKPEPVTSAPRLQSWRQAAAERAGGGGSERPTQREAQRTRNRAVSVRTSARGDNARSAGGRASASTSAGGANARSAGGRASARTSAGGADARSAGAGASARTSARGANARSAEGRASASTSAGGANARSAGGRAPAPKEQISGVAPGGGLMIRCRTSWRSSGKMLRALVGLVQMDSTRKRCGVQALL